MIQVSVYSLYYSLLSRHRVVLLREEDGDRFLPIFVGLAESESIAIRLQETPVPRPLTHDLLLSIVRELGGSPQYAVVSELSDNVFYARLAISQNGEIKYIDSRSSDAIAFALRASIPIYVEESVFDRAGIKEAERLEMGEKTPDDELDVYRDLIDSLDMDDMGRE